MVTASSARRWASPSVRASGAPKFPSAPAACVTRRSAPPSGGRNPPSAISTTTTRPARHCRQGGGESQARQDPALLILPSDDSAIERVACHSWLDVGGGTQLAIKRRTFDRVPNKATRS